MNTLPMKILSINALPEVSMPELATDSSAAIANSSAAIANSSAAVANSSAQGVDSSADSTTEVTDSQIIDAELSRLATEGPTARELDQARNSIEADFLGSLETVMEKADLMNSYYYERGTPDGFQADLDALRNVSADDVQRVVRNYLLGPRVIVSVVPQGQPELAAAARVVP